MRAQGQERLRLLNLSPKPAWTEVWHLWKVIIPRRSISGKLLTGQVWRRYDGRRWIYKKFTEYTDAYQHAGGDTIEPRAGAERD